MPATHDDPVLEVDAVDKSFPGVRALSQVTFTLLPGQVHALVGENGAGKSTLIKVMTGVYQPDGGQLRVSGEPQQFANPLEAQRAGISTIYQEVNLIPLMSVARNLFLGREPRRGGILDIRRMNAEAAEVLVGYGLAIDVSRPLRTLGLGAQQMVALARAVQIDARVVIMDEPTSSLEQREVRTLFTVIRRLHDQGIAIVYVSHRLDELYEICDAVTVMRDGQVVHTGSLADTDRLRLISLMLGRDLATAERAGARSAIDAPAATETPVLRAEHLSIRHQLNDVSLAIAPGEVVGLGGLLGAGRSETAKAIAGDLKLDAGTVHVRDRELRRHTNAESIRAGVALLPEDRKAEGIIPSLSVRENIVLAALPRLSRLGIVSRGKQDEVVKYFIDRLRIKVSSAEQKVSELSGGNQQKVLLARLLCMQPKVLLLDEPTRGIDVGAKAEVQTLIDELARDGLGVLLISSELDELIAGSDRVVVLKDGAVIGELIGEDVNEDELLQRLAAAPPSPDTAGEVPGGQH